MRSIILYTSKTGAAQECASILTTEIGDCAICDLAEITPDLDKYDLVVIGSGVRASRFYKPVRTFIEKNKDLLQTKKLAFFICNAAPVTLREIISKNIPQELQEHAVCIKSLGGKPPFKAKATGWLLNDNLHEFVKALLS